MWVLLEPLGRPLARRFTEQHTEPRSMTQKARNSGLPDFVAALCDVAEVERVRDLVKEEFLGRALGCADTLSLGLTNQLAKPLLRFREDLISRTGAVRMERAPTDEFIDCINEVKSSLREGPWPEERGEALAEKLRIAWLIWIANVASCEIWHGVPHRNQVARKSQINGARGGRSKVFDTAAIIKAYENLVHQGKEKRSIVGIVANRIGCSATHVRAVMKNKKKEPTG